MEWERIQGKGDIRANLVLRAQVPGGWLVMVESAQGVAITFYPDPAHEWKAERAAAL